jgi:hypothetical protein
MLFYLKVNKYFIGSFTIKNMPAYLEHPSGVEEVCDKLAMAS